jgi:hypothetical protein
MLHAMYYEFTCDSHGFVNVRLLGGMVVAVHMVVVAAHVLLVQLQLIHKKPFAHGVCKTSWFLTAVKECCVRRYAVQVGRQPGVYDSWPDCQKQVHGYKGAVFKGFATLAEARSFACLSKRGTQKKRARDGHALTQAHTAQRPRQVPAMSFLREDTESCPSHLEFGVQSSDPRTSHVRVNMV